MSFSSDVKRFSDNAQKRLDQQVRAITLDLFSSIILSSPVGNPTLWKHPAPKGYVGGRFRANWNTAAGQPDFTTTFNIDTTGAEAIARAASKIGPAGGVQYMSNALPYGIRLEYEGWSK